MTASDPTPADLPSRGRQPAIARTIDELRRHVGAFRTAGEYLGLVPTMGALHAGHLALVAASRLACDRTIVSIFVNPTQFAPHEDLAKYPRPFEEDVRLLAEAGVDVVFAPEPGEMYPPGASTTVSPPAVAGPLEGERRPTHFAGVCTVVLKLFNIVTPDAAFFGQKDYQQALVILRMVADLDIPVRVVVRPTVREADGLAMSSRNRYLSDDERRRALAISRGLTSAEGLAGAGERSAAALEAAVTGELADAGIVDVDYVTLRSGTTLLPLTAWEPGAVLLVACRVGTTRLIDNAVLAGPAS